MAMSDSRLAPHWIRAQTRKNSRHPVFQQVTYQTNSPNYICIWLFFFFLQVCLFSHKFNQNVTSWLIKLCKDVKIYILPISTIKPVSPNNKNNCPDCHCVHAVYMHWLSILSLTWLLHSSASTSSSFSLSAAVFHLHQKIAAEGCAAPSSLLLFISL